MCALYSYDGILISKTIRTITLPSTREELVAFLSGDDMRYFLAFAVSEIIVTIVTIAKV